jgi:cyanosortase A-associated protein
MIKTFERVRFGLIILLLAGIFGVLGKINLYPNQRNTNITFILPKTLELPNWQFNASQPINKNHPQVENGKNYRYLQNGTAIDIEIHHVINTDGDVRGYLEDYKSLSLSQVPSVRQNEQTGFYGLFSEGTRSHLSACINPRGQSTFTGVQFARNRNTFDLKPERVFPWLLGQSELRDYRCLWVILSISHEGNLTNAYQLLENTWFALQPGLQLSFSK